MRGLVVVAAFLGASAAQAGPPEYCSNTPPCYLELRDPPFEGLRGKWYWGWIEGQNCGPTLWQVEAISGKGTVQWYVYKRPYDAQQGPEYAQADRIGNYLQVLATPGLEVHVQATTLGGGGFAQTCHAERAGAE